MRSEAEIREAIQIVILHLQHIEVPDSKFVLQGSLAALCWMLEQNQETQLGLATLISDTKAFMRAQRQ